MIAHLSGTILGVAESSCVLDVHGVGYRVYCTEQHLGTLAIGDECSLHTYLAVREDALDLFGFRTPEEHTLFTLLIGVSGIGPRSALGIIGLESAPSLASAIAQGNVAYLTRVSGVGKKSAEKIVLELKDKMQTLHFADTTGTHAQGDEDVLDALRQMGYRADEVREVLPKLSPDTPDQGERIKEALRLLSHQ